jgi:hypothetical protein
VARAEGLMLPVQRFEIFTDDLDLSATIGHLYARHQPRVAGSRPPWPAAGLCCSR